MRSTLIGLLIAIFAAVSGASRGVFLPSTPYYAGFFEAGLPVVDQMKEDIEHEEKKMMSKRRQGKDHKKTFDVSTKKFTKKIVEKTKGNNKGTKMPGWFGGLGLDEVQEFGLE